MNSLQKSILRELIITICAGDQDVLKRADLERVLRRIEHYVSELPLFFCLVFKMALYLINYALPPLSWKLRPFTWLALEQRLTYLGEWQSSGFYYKRIIFKMVQSICALHLYSEKELLVGMGFEPSMARRRQRPTQ